MQRGRKSLNKFAINVEGKPAPLQPPKYLNAAERKFFCELIAAVDTRHFVESDLPLIVSYTQATLMARSAARDPEQIAIWEKSARMQAMLATRLRLAPQARADAKTIARRQQEYHGPRPSEL